MNRTDRLLAIVLEIQSKKTCRAEDLAATFETSKRTIYRDIQALCEAGVPVVAIPGLGYKLSEGYFLPPLTFSSDEAVMLLLGSKFVADNFDEEYRAAALTARKKINGVLPEKLVNEVQERQERIRLVNFIEDDTDTLKGLRRSVIENQTVTFEYYARAGEDNAPILREVDPYGIVLFDGAWYLTAYCHLRKGLRHFRLERISQLKFTGKGFERPADFKLEQIQNYRTRDITVKVLFNSTVARWVRESRNFFITTMEEVEGGLLVTLNVRKENDVTSWIMGWGSNAIVLEPLSLRQQILQEVRQIEKNYQNSQTLLT